MKLIILSITQYKEKDGIIFGISEEGVHNFTVKGMLDPKNKNASLNNPLSIVDVEVDAGKYKYPIVKNSKILFSPLKVNSDYYHLSSISFLIEVTKKLLQDDEKVMMYKHLSQAIMALKEAQEPWMILLIYLCNIFKATGYEFQVDECVFCGNRKNIATFSFADGGFICQNCLEGDTEKPFNNEQMLLLRAAYMAFDYTKVNQYCTKDNALAILKRCNEFIVDSFGTSISAIAFLDK